MAGVSVNVQGSSGGTITDADGKFTIQVSKGATLVLSFVGAWDNKAYLFPISREEMNKNNMLVQNPGYQ